MQQFTFRKASGLVSRPLFPTSPECAKNGIRQATRLCPMSLSELGARTHRVTDRLLHKHRREYGGSHMASAKLPAHVVLEYLQTSCR